MKAEESFEWTGRKLCRAECSYYIPSRFDEDYGLNSDALDRIKKAGAELVITVDCGCLFVAEVAHAHEIGLEIIVTDHHELKGELPDCVLIDPKQPGCGYPFKSLAGVGVAFKFAQAISAELGLPKQTVTRNLDQKRFMQIFVNQKKKVQRIGKGFQLLQSGLRK